MSAGTEHCGNCKRDVTAANFRIHSAHCERHITLCKICSEPFPRTESEKHNDLHSLGECPDCGLTVEKWQLNKHKEECSAREVICHYCDLNFRLNLLDEHVEACGSRTEKCAKCNNYVMLRDTEKHKDGCMKTEKAFCPYCGNQFAMEIMPSHVEDCNERKNCKKNQDAGDEAGLKDQAIALSPKQKRSDLYEQMKKAQLEEDCLIDCMYCGIQMPFDYVAQHMKDCRSTKTKDTSQHTDSDSRFLNPRLRAESLLTCEFCKESFKKELAHDHIVECGARTEKCMVCQNYVQLRHKHNHHETCNMQSTQGKCKICDQRVPWIDMVMHEAVCVYTAEPSCNESERNRKIAAVSLSGQRTSETSERKMNVSCEKKYFNCALCMEPVLHADKKEHELYSCRAVRTGDDRVHFEKFDYERRVSPQRETDSSEKMFQQDSFTSCPYCEGHILDHKYQFHLELCSQQKKKCQFCKDDFPITDEKEHLEKCSKVFTEEGYTGVKSKNKRSRHKNAKKQEKREGFFDKFNPFRSLDGKESHAKTTNKVPPYEQQTFCNSHRSTSDSTTSHHHNTQAPALVTLPCEFCDESFPEDLLIEHESGCRPDLMSYPQDHSNYSSEDQNQRKEFDSRHVEKSTDNKYESPANLPEKMKGKDYRSYSSSGHYIQPGSYLGQNPWKPSGGRPDLVSSTQDHSNDSSEAQYQRREFDRQHVGKTTDNKFESPTNHPEKLKGKDYRSCSSSGHPIKPGSYLDQTPSNHLIQTSERNSQDCVLHGEGRTTNNMKSSDSNSAANTDNTTVGAKRKNLDDKNTSDVDLLHDTRKFRYSTKQHDQPQNRPMLYRSTMKRDTDSEEEHQNQVNERVFSFGGKGSRNDFKFPKSSINQVPEENKNTGIVRIDRNYKVTPKCQSIYQPCSEETYVNRAPNTIHRKEESFSLKDFETHEKRNSNRSKEETEVPSASSTIHRKEESFSSKDFGTDEKRLRNETHPTASSNNAATLIKPPPGFKKLSISDDLDDLVSNVRETHAEPPTDSVPSNDNHSEKKTEDIEFDTYLSFLNKDSEDQWDIRKSFDFLSTSPNNNAKTDPLHKCQSALCQTVCDDSTIPQSNKNNNNGIDSLDSKGARPKSISFIPQENANQGTSPPSNPLYRRNYNPKCTSMVIRCSCGVPLSAVSEDCRSCQRRTELRKLSSDEDL